MQKPPPLQLSLRHKKFMYGLLSWSTVHQLSKLNLYIISVRLCSCLFYTYFLLYDALSRLLEEDLLQGDVIMSAFVPNLYMCTGDFSDSISGSKIASDLAGLQVFLLWRGISTMLTLEISDIFKKKTFDLFLCCTKTANF